MCGRNNAGKDRSADAKNLIFPWNPLCMDDVENCLSELAHAA
jgi:hypothetical protein